MLLPRTSDHYLHIYYGGIYIRITGRCSSTHTYVHTKEHTYRCVAHISIMYVCAHYIRRDEKLDTYVRNYCVISFHVSWEGSLKEARNDAQALEIVTYCNDPLHR